AAPFAEAVKRVALVAERNTPVRLTFSDGEVLLEAGTGDEAQASEAIGASFDGDDLQIAFNPQFLLDGIGAVDSDVARISFTSPTGPAGPPGRGGARRDSGYGLIPTRRAGCPGSARNVLRLCWPALAKYARHVHLTRLALTDFRSYGAVDVMLEPG